MAESAHAVRAPARRKDTARGARGVQCAPVDAVFGRPGQPDYAAMLNGRPALATQHETAAHLAGRAAPGPMPVQRAATPNRTGLPDRLKQGIEALSGVSLNGVRVRYNSPKPAQLHAYAYAQGEEIHLAPGQEQHLPHEAWHVVQQAQGRVKPTRRTKSGVRLNDEPGLEREADTMGHAAPAHSARRGPAPSKPVVAADIVQGKFFRRMPGETSPQAQPQSGPGSSESARQSPSIAASSSVEEKQPEPSVGTASPMAASAVVYTVQPEAEVVKDALATSLAQNMSEAELKRAIKKLAEGPDVSYASLPELEAILVNFLRSKSNELKAGKTTPLGQWRKINRIAGSIAEKLQLYHGPAGLDKLFAQLQEVSAAIAGIAASDDFAKGGKRAAEVLGLAVATLDTFQGDVTKLSARGMWKAFDIVSNFGPLAHALIIATQDEDVRGLNERILRDLRSIRQMMARNPDGPTVVAHRGMGPTNKTMGGLIGDKDNRRLNKPVENSPAAFLAAFGHAGALALDGVECDVFLSSDGVPMLSHESDVREQLSSHQRSVYSALKESDQLHHFTADRLMTIQRKEEDKLSIFSTLWGLLINSVDVAEKYYRLTGKAFRIEVEMKGTMIHKGNDPDAERRPMMLESSVAKNISQLHKKYPGLPVEIVLFNGDRAQVQRYSELRSKKTAFGATYTALGPKAEALRQDNFERMYIDELRYQFTEEISREKPEAADLGIADKYLEDFIVTLVPGQEFAPLELEGLRSMEPSHPLERRGKLDKNPPKRDFDDHIQSALERYASRADQRKLQKLHILTDYPAKAAWMKERLIKASEGALKRIGNL